MLSMRELCELTGKPGKPRDRKTVTKWIQAGRYPNAVRATTGRQEWAVPVQDLVDAGDLEAAQVLEVAATLDTLRESRQVTELRARVTELDVAVAVADALASERLTTLKTLQTVITTMTATGADR
jgi:hypothetical protein